MFDSEEANLSRDEIDALADEIALAACRIDAAQRVLLTNIRAFDQAGGWAWQGAKSCAAWLSWRIGCGQNAANERVRVAKALGALPRIDTAFGAGELSYCKVRAMTRVATPDNEALLLDQARSATGAELERICASVREVLRPRDAQGGDDVRYVRRRHAGLGMTRIEAQLYADEAERVWQALASVRRELETAPGGRAPGAEVEAAGVRCEASSGVHEASGAEAEAAGVRCEASSGVHEASGAAQARAASPADEGVVAWADGCLDGLLVEDDGEPFAPIVADGYTYGETSSGAPAKNPNDLRSTSFRGNCAAATEMAGALEATGGARAPGRGEEDVGRPGLADALVAVAEVALRRGIGSRPRPAAERRQLLVHVTEDRLAELAGFARASASSAGIAAGAAVPSCRDTAADVALVAELHHGVRLGGETLLRIACDAGLVVAKTSVGGDVLDIGRRSRTVTAPLLRALWVRDRGCRFPGCTQVAFVEAHHLAHWVRGGATSLANTALLCHHHHVCVHEGGFHMERDASGDFCFADPEGRPIPAAPTPPSLDEPVFAAFARAELERGIALTDTTSLIHRDFRHPDLRGAANAVIACTLGAHT